MFRTVLGPAQSPIQWLPEVLLPGVKRPGREVNNSYPYSVRNENGKGKVRPRTGHEGPEWEKGYGFTLSLTSAIDGGWLVSATPLWFSLRERNAVPIVQETG